MNLKIDSVDGKILDLIQSRGDRPKSEIAQKVGLTPSAVAARIDKLRHRGLLVGCHYHLAPGALGLDCLAFVLVRTRAKDMLGAGRQIGALPGVQEVHHIAGEDCFLVKVRARSTKVLGELLRRRVNALPAVISTRTTIVLETLKDECLLPLPTPEPKRRRT